MSGEQRIAIDVEVLGAHRRRLEQIGADLAVARDATAATDLGGGAFGLMCAFMVPPLQLVQAAAQRALGQVSASVDRAGREVVAAGDDLAAADERGVQQYRALQADLDRAGNLGGRSGW